MDVGERLHSPAQRRRAALATRRVADFAMSVAFAAYGQTRLRAAVDAKRRISGAASGVRAMPRADWRLPSAYQILASLDAPGFAWQFLSRNPEFHRACNQLARDAAEGRLSADDETAFAKRWGARFRGAGHQRWRGSAADMDTRGPAVDFGARSTAERTRRSCTCA